MDSIVTSVIKQFKTRSEFGEKKYGVNMDRDDLMFPDWVTHMKILGQGLPPEIRDDYDTI